MELVRLVALAWGLGIPVLGHSLYSGAPIDADCQAKILDLKDQMEILRKCEIDIPSSISSSNLF